MRRLMLLLVAASTLLLVGCGALNPFPKRIHSTPPSGQPASPSEALPHDWDPKTRPYTVMGKTYYPLKNAAGYDEVGEASWYGKDFHGKKTANGYIYDMYGISAAHKTLPLGTQVRVTNLENQRSVVLMINDRGPFMKGRILDLSYGAAQVLGSVEAGVVRVRITAIGSYPTRTASADPASAPAAAIKYYHVRVGAFADINNAKRLHRQLIAQGYSDASIQSEERSGGVLHIVQAGSFISLEKAEKVLEDLKGHFPSCYIVS